jgi:hypothetical protein
MLLFNRHRKLKKLGPLWQKGGEADVFLTNHDYQ